MRPSRTRLLATILVIIALAACGDDDSSADPDVTTTGAAVTTTAVPGGDAIDACGLVTQEDAERILGEPVEFTATTEPEVVVAACVWSNTAADHGATLQFRVFDGPHFFTEDAFATVEGYAPLDGLGDDAYWVVTGNVATLTVLSGDLVLMLDASKGGGGFDAAFVQTELAALAERVLAEL